MTRVDKVSSSAPLYKRVYLPLFKDKHFQIKGDNLVEMLIFLWMDPISTNLLY